MVRLRVSCCLVLALLSAPSLAAQPPSTKFITGTMGVGEGYGDPVLQRTILNVDVAGGLIFRQRRHYSLVGGAFGGFTHEGPTGYGVAVSECPIAPSTQGCRPYAPYAPAFEYAGLMMGIETPPSRAVSVGLGLGPAALQTSRITGTEKDVIAGRAFGVQSRVDFSVGGRARFVVSGRNILIPNYRTKRINIATLNLGVRLER